MTWTFFYLMLLIKLPVAGMLWLVWRMLREHDSEQPVVESEDGGGNVPRDHHPRSPRPRPPRRGPHREAGAPASPARVRSVLVRTRRVQH